MMRTPILLGLAGALLVNAPASFAGDDNQFIMLDRSMRATLVTVAAIGPASVSLTGNHGDSREMPLGDVVALAPGWWRPGTEGSEASWYGIDRGAKRRAGTADGMLLLTDGRRLVGHLGAGAGDERLAWEHPRLGKSVFRLDDVRRIQVAPAAEAVVAPGALGARGAGDRVVTTNGDVVSGFVDSIGDSVKMESEGKKLDLALKQVATVELANPAKPATGARLWLYDGSVVRAKGFAPAEKTREVLVQLDTLTGAEPSPPASLSIGEVVAFTPEAGRLVPLASLAPESQRGIGERRYVDPMVLRWRGRVLGANWREAAAPGIPAPPLDAPDIELPGPMSVEWALPAGASRFSGWAEVPSEARLWADFTLVIEGVGGAPSGGESVSEAKRAPLASESMNGTRPVVEFNIEIPRPAPERLRISIEPGARGPIQDRVAIRRALILVDPARQ